MPRRYSVVPWLDAVEDLHLSRSFEQESYVEEDAGGEYGDAGRAGEYSFARICLDLREARQDEFKAAHGFLHRHREQLGLGVGERGLLGAFLDLVWPDGVPATLIASNIGFDSRCPDLLLRPVSWGPEAGRYAAAHQTLGMRVFRRQGRLVVKGFEVTPHVPRRAHEVVVSAPLCWNPANLWMESGDLDALARLPPHRAGTGKRLEEWRTYLDWKEELVKKLQLKVPYLAWRRDGELHLSFLVRAEDIENRRVKGQELSALPPDETEDQEEDEQERPERPRRHRREPDPIALGEVDEVEKVAPRGAAGRKWGERLPRDTRPLCQLRIRLDEDVAKVLQEQDEPLPEQGRLVSAIAGDLAALNNQRQAINRLQNSQGFCPRLADFLFAARSASVPGQVAPLEPLASASRRLNPEQADAVAKALAAPDICLIQGPPGTGKTTVIAEICLRVVRGGGRVLVASQTNLAVDNALSRLDDRPEIRRLRLGRTDRVDEDFREFLEDRVVEHWFSTLASACSGRLERTRRLETELSRERSRLEALRAALEAHGQAQAALHELEGQLEALRRRRAPLEEQSRREEGRLHEALGRAELWQQLHAWAEGKEAAPEGTDSVPLPALEAPVRQVQALLSPRDPVGNFKGLALLDAVRARAPDLEPLRSLLVDARRCCADSTGSSSAELAELLAARQRLASSEDEADAARLPDLNRRIRKLQGDAWARLSGAIRLAASKFFAGSVPEAVEQLADTLQPGSSSLPALEVCEQLVEAAAAAAHHVAQALPELAPPFARQAEEELARAVQAEQEARRLRQEIEDLQREQDALAEARERRQAELSAARTRWGEEWRPLHPEGEACPPPSAQALEDAAARHRRRRQEDEASLERRRRWSGIQEEWLLRLGRLSESDRVHLRALYIQHANVVGMTCNEAGKRQTYQAPGFQPFDMVIIDEVSKATPPELIMPMLLGRKVVLVGDHRQLPPMFRERDLSFGEAGEEGELDPDTVRRFEKMVTASLFQELFEAAPDELKAMLWEQYRMHPQVMDVVNQFYSGRLRPGALPGARDARQALDAGRQHHLRIPDGRGGFLLEPHQHLLWVDSSVDEKQQPHFEEQRGTSKVNRLEVRLLLSVLGLLDGALRERGYGRQHELEVERGEAGRTAFEFVRARLEGVPASTLEDLFAARRVRVQGRSRKKEQPVQPGETVCVDARRQVGLLTFYGAQLREIRHELDTERRKDPQAFASMELRTNTVDRFQGMERPIVVASLVRSVKGGMGGFVRQFQRINVGLSRAQELLVVLGAADSFRKAVVDLPPLEGGAPRQAEQVHVYGNIIELARQYGGTRHAWQLTR